MALLSTLALLAITAQQGSTMTLAGRVIPIVYPEPVVVQVPDEVKNWDGFQGLTDKEWPTPFRSTGDWNGITQKLSALGPVPKDKPTWKTKVFILTQTDSLWQDNGSFRQSRLRLDQKDIDAALRAIARAQGFVRAATDDAVIPTFDVEIDNEPTVLPSGEGSRGWFADYVNSKVNNGHFEAEDKVFRGPWDSIVVLTPGSEFGRIGSNSSVASAFDLWSKDGDYEGLERQISKQIAYDAANRLQDMGIALPGMVRQQIPYYPELPGHLSPKAWKALQASEEPTLEVAAELIGMNGKLHDDRDNLPFFPTREAPISGNVHVSIVNDDQRGSALKYSEFSAIRNGGFALPYKAVEVAKTPILSFWAKTSSRDGMSLHLADGSGMTRFGRILSLPVPSDGAWHQVVVDLRNGSWTRITDMVLGPGPNARLDRQQIGEIVYLFDDFQLSASGETNVPATPLLSEEVKRAQSAKDLSAAELAKDPSDLVKLNGLISHQGAYAASDEPALIELTKSVNVRIAAEAVRRLAELGTPTAKSEVLRLVTASPFEHVKQAAALEVGKIGDPKTAGILSRLFASKSWQTRNAGAKAVSMLPGDDAAVTAMVFLQENDPLIRLNATRGANAQNAVVLKRLLWSTVNDPSDAVRAESAWKLINSGKPKEAAEGYKAVRDDSVGVRLDLINRMAKNPAEAHRGALRIAVIDLSPRVRAAALRAFIKLPEEVKPEEVANTFEDKLPIVQLALLDLAKARSLALPANAVASLKASIDPRVVQGAKDLGL